MNDALVVAIAVPSGLVTRAQTRSLSSARFQICGAVCEPPESRSAFGDLFVGLGQADSDAAELGSRSRPGLSGDPVGWVIGQEVDPRTFAIATLTAFRTATSRTLRMSWPGPISR